MQPGNPFSDSAFAGQATGLRALIDQVGVYFYAKDLDGRYLFVNHAVCVLFGASFEEVLGARDERFLDLGRSPAVRDNDRRVLVDGEELHAEEEHFLRSGEHRVFWSIKVPIRDPDGRITGLCGMSTDITRRRHAADQVIERNSLLSTILSNIDALVYLKDADGKFLYANQKVTDLYGRSLNEIIGRTDLELLPQDIAIGLMEMDRSVFASATRQAREEIVIGADGAEHHYWSIKLPMQFPGQAPCLIGFSTDITELLTLKQSLEQQRITDPLTGLANRLQFETRLAQELRAAERNQGQLAVVLLDLDQFKYINNSLGQEVGDQLLQAVAERLRTCDTGIGIHVGNLARLSGDEFVMTLPQLHSPDDAMNIVERARHLLAAPYHLLGRPFHLTVSAGISLYPDDALQVQALIGHAESAMYFAKERGRDQCRFYSRELGNAVSYRLELERDLRAALAANQFELYYQPKINARDGSVAGVEALLRWNRDGHGQMSPAQFIPLAEQLGLLVQMGKWVIEEACRQIAAWRSSGIGRVSVAVNLSPSQLSSPLLIDHVTQILKTCEISDGDLEMEVTESMMMDDPEQAIAILHALRKLGVRLSIDDFGTGFSSMAYLKRLPVDALKLDRQFVMHIASDSRDADICAGMIALAHKLGLSVVAEGVETEAQRDALAARDCDVFQGYLYSRPLSADNITAFLRR